MMPLYTLPIRADAGDRWEADLNALDPGSVLAIDRRSGQSETLPAEVLTRLAGPSDLDPNRLLAFHIGSGVRLRTPSRCGFRLNWVGQAASGKLETHLGILTRAELEAGVEIAVNGSLLGALWRESDRLRLCMFSRGDCAGGLDVRATAAARLDVAHEGRDLILAILGAHPLQWLRSMSERARGGRPGEALVRFFDLWEDLDSFTATAIWEAAGDPTRLEALRAWMLRIVAEASDENSLRQLFQAHMPQPDSDPARWIEALAGSLWGAAAGVAGLEKLQAAARNAEKLLADAALVQVLTELKRQACEEAARALQDAVPEAVWELAPSVRQKAATALSSKLTAELSYQVSGACSDEALFDGSFDCTEAGIAALRAALAGDLTSALDERSGHVQLHLALLTHGVRRHSVLDLNLPFLDRKQWSSRLETLASVRIEPTTDGRLLVYTLSAKDELTRQDLARSAMSLCGVVLTRSREAKAQFSLQHSDVRRLSGVQARSVLPPLLTAYRFETARQWLESVLPQAREVEIELALSVPGEMVAAWLDAPVERSPNFGPVYTEVSVTVQQAMRTWLPYVYFSDLSRYDTLGAAYPLVVYQCTLPFRSKAKNEFAYDVMSAESVAVARRSTGWALAAELARIEQLLVAAGKPETARFYRPSRKDVILASVERAPRLFHALLVADALFIDQLIRLGVRAGGLRQAMQHEPQRAVRELARFGEEFVKTFHRRLRRLYGGQDFVSFGPLILVEATRALSGALRSVGALCGVCRLRIEDGGAVIAERTFTNVDYRL